MPAQGLSSAQILTQRAAHGSNVLTPPPRTPGWKLYLQKFDDPVIRILMIAAGIATAVGAIDGHVAEGIGILVAILLATFLAYWNESRAAREFDVLNTTRDDVPVKVIRDGGYTTVPKRDVVVGDAVFIEVGEEVPADGTVVDATGLLVNESRLTGEAVPVPHETESKLLRGTTIVEGSALYEVTAVGDRTEIGRTLVESIVETGDESPLNKQLAKLSQVIGVVGFGIAALAFVALSISGLVHGTIQLHEREAVFLTLLFASIGVALVNVWLPVAYDALDLFGLAVETPSWLGGMSWLVTIVLGLLQFAGLAGLAVLVGGLPPTLTEWIDRTDAQALLRNFMIAVTIIVVAVPEGLAMSVTLSLAYSMRKMTAQNTLVRKLDACETIGAATVICSDKTGTLTMNQMRVAELFIGNEVITDKPRNEELEHQLFELLKYNTTAKLSFKDGIAEALGNPTEGALLLWAHEQSPRFHSWPMDRSGLKIWSFDSDRKYMATRVPTSDDPKLHIKGAPEIVLARCTMIAIDHGWRPMTDADRHGIQERLKDYQTRGLRTLGLAYRYDLPDSDDIEVLAREMAWLAVVAIADPIRPDVPAAIAACRRAGIGVKVVTGDNAATASEIAKQIGLDAGDTLTGPEFAALSDDEAKARAGTLSVLARARPADKLRLVRLLKERGEVVAVTGDGVNDGPALNHADVGLAMGKTGTAVAREASDIILLDDSFPSILSAVRWGRALYENIQRFILFQLTINVVALGLALLGPLLGYDLPLTVMQMLWVNLIMDTFAALALATEPPHDGVLDRMPRSPNAFIVTKAMARGIFGTGVVFLAVLIGLMVYFQSVGELQTDDPSRAGTILFTTFVLLQFWNLFNAKAFARGGSVFRTLGNNPSFLAIAAAILIGQVVLVQFGGTVFRTVPLSMMDWLIVFASTSLVLIVGEVRRLWQ